MSTSDALAAAVALAFISIGDFSAGMSGILVSAAKVRLLERIIERVNTTIHVNSLFMVYPPLMFVPAYSDEVGRLFRRKSAGHSAEVGHPLRGLRRWVKN
jgi:hypothetical protein